MATPRYSDTDEALQNVLTMAACDGLVDLARSIVSHGVADVNRVGTGYIYNPLHSAMLNGHSSIVSILLTCDDLDLVGVQVLYANK